jgi:hypothetical protein
MADPIYHRLPERKPRPLDKAKPQAGGFKWRQGVLFCVVPTLAREDVAVTGKPYTRVTVAYLCPACGAFRNRELPLFQMFGRYRVVPLCPCGKPHPKPPKQRPGRYDRLSRQLWAEIREYYRLWSPHARMARLKAEAERTVFIEDGVIYMSASEYEDEEIVGYL